MIKDPNERDYIFSHFPTAEKAIWEEINRYAMPQFLFYTKSGNFAECYCTSCRQRETFRRSIMIDGIEIPSNSIHNDLKHNEYGFCPMCGHSVQYKCKGRGHKTLAVRDNFCIFLAKDNNLYIDAIKYEIDYWNDDVTNPHTDVFYFRRYAFTPGEAQEWRYKGWCGKWIEMKSLSEPKFFMTSWYPSFCCGGISYTCINEQAIAQTFLKYSCYKNYVEACDSENMFLMSFLNFSAKYTKLSEQLIKSGFEDIVYDITEENMYGFSKLINLKADGVKKALNFTVPEINYWRDYLPKEKMFMLSCYLKCKKVIPDFQKIIHLFTEYNADNTVMFCDILKRLKISPEKAENYLLKQTKRKGDFGTKLREWNDCLNMLDQMDYPKNSVLRIPKNLSKTHDKLVTEMNARKEEIAAKKFECLNKKLRRLIYCNKDYTIVIPASEQDIKREGKILDHCVGSYAERHSKGVLHILFIRPHSDIDTPYFTIEVSKDGYIKQCHGYKNERTRKKPDSIKQFEKEYALFLDYRFGRIEREEYLEKIGGTVIERLRIKTTA